MSTEPVTQLKKEKQKTTLQVQQKSIKGIVWVWNTCVHFPANHLHIKYGAGVTMLSLAQRMEAASKALSKVVKTSSICKAQQ